MMIREDVLDVEFCSKIKLRRRLKMATNKTEHTCIQKCYGAMIEFNKRKKQWILYLKHTEKEGKLQPKTYLVEYPIKFCPFCGVSLYKEAKPHLESCNCTLCSVKKSKKGFGRSYGY